jgi:Tfp pilus assembly protein PilN
MKNVMEQEQIQKKHESNQRFWLIWSISAAIIAVVMGFYGWKSWRLDQENQGFELSIKNTQKEIQDLAPGATEELARTRKEVVSRARKHRTNWSEIMAQIIDLESSAVRFSKINLSGKKISASCQATSWNSLTIFIESLRADSRVDNVRMSSTTVLSPPVAGAKQGAELTFDFIPTKNENE